MLNNIFKKRIKKEGTSKKPQIVVDIHEKDSSIAANLIELGAEINLISLQVGDFVIADTIFERKTFSDFISSMLSKRLIEQLNQLKNHKSILILENYREMNELKGNLNPNSIKGMILSVINDYNIPVIFTKDSDETASYLFLFAKRQLKPQIEMSLHSRIPKTKKEQQRYILESFQNIGPKTADKLLKEFKTLKNIFNANPENIKKNIGKKAEAFDILDKNY